MSAQASDKPATIAPVTSTPKRQPDASIVADDCGRAIVALLQKAADVAKDDRGRALGLAHQLSIQLRAAEERVRELQEEVAYFRDRATRAEEWLQRIHSEVERGFFQKKDRAPRQGPQQ